MNVNEQNNLISRETAWWFIPEEYCPIFLELEKEFNKQIDVRRQISELEKKINDTPVFKRGPLKDCLTNLNAKREHFSRERIVEIVELLRDDRCIHYSELADKRLDSHMNVKGEEDNTFRKFVRYADIMGDKSITKVIVDRFIKYFEKLGILVNENGEYYLEHYSNHIANYKVPFVTAQIIIEYITSDLLSNRASRMMIFEAIHRLNQNPLVDIEIDNGKSREKALYDVYRKILTSGLEILRNNGFIRESKDNDIQYEFVYKQEDESQQETHTHIEIQKKRNNERKVAALKELAEIHARFHQTTNTSEEKKKNKLRSAQSKIDEKLSRIDQSSKNGRITYHWYSVILQCRNSFEFRKFKTFAEDVITYIRYQNIKNAITPVDKDKLYRWEKSYPVWDALGKFIQEEAKLRIISWPISVSDSEYRKAARNILNVIDDLIGNDTYKIVISSGQDESIVEQQKMRNDQIFSLFYVRAEVESTVMHSNATMHLEQLFNILTVRKNKNYIDLCLIIYALHLLIGSNTFEYPSKLKLWEFALNNIPNENITFDIQITKLCVYSLLLVISIEEGIKNKYSALCASILYALQAENHEQEVEIIRQLTLFVDPDLDILSYTEAAKLSYNLYVKIENMLKMGDGNNDPRIYVYKYELFAYASLFLSRYLDFGYSLPILLSQAYSHLKSLKIVDDVKNRILLNCMATLLKNLMPAYSLRIIITNALSQDYGPLSYHYLLNYLLQSNNFELALEYVLKAEQLYDYNLGNIQGQTLYLDLLLNKVRILLYLGRETEAKTILLECDAKIKQAEELYPPIIRSRLLQGAVDNIREINLTLETRPFIYRGLRLLYILMQIEKMDSLTKAVELFYKKWNGFNGLDLDEDKSNPTELIVEFKSDIFPSVMEAVAQNVDFNTISIDTTQITEEEITRLNNELKDLYEREQQSFIKTECLTTQSVALTYDMLFKLLEPKRNAEAFVHKMKLTNEKEDSDKSSTLDDLELYHYIALSEYVSKDNKLSACKRFIDSLDIDRLDQSERYVYLHEMAAEVLCEMSSLVDFADWDKQEKLLNQAESYIVNKDGSIISDRAKEIYLRIMHRLYDVYDYQGRSGMQESLMVEHALELIKSNNIRTVDAAWFLGERAEYRLYINKDRQQAKSYFDKAISILKEIIPATEDSLHYLDIYQKEVVNL